MPTVWMLIGVPAAGKSTWIKNNPKPGVIVSTDDKIAAYAEHCNKTYDEVFRSYIKHATTLMELDVKKAIADDADIVWDQTNTTRKSRAGKLLKIPSHYRKVAVFFPTPEKEELARRLASRAGKTIPSNIVYSMISMLEPPDLNEGWDQIINVVQ